MKYIFLIYILNNANECHAITYLCICCDIFRYNLSKFNFWIKRLAHLIYKISNHFSKRLHQFIYVFLYSAWESLFTILGIINFETFAKVIYTKWILDIVLIFNKKNFNKNIDCVFLKDFSDPVTSSNFFYPFAFLLKHIARI